MANEEDEQKIFKQPNTTLEEAGFDESVYRKKNFFEAPIENLGKTSTPMVPNVLDNQISHQQLLDKTIPDTKILTSHNVFNGTAKTLDNGDTVINCNTTNNAITLTLPNARNTLGKTYIISLVTDGGNNVTLNTDSTDQFNGVASATGTSVVFADAGDYIHLIAMGNDLWLVLSTIGGSFS